MIAGYSFWYDTVLFVNIFALSSSKLSFRFGPLWVFRFAWDCCKRTSSFFLNFITTATKAPTSTKNSEPNVYPRPKSVRTKPVKTHVRCGRSVRTYMYLFWYCPFVLVVEQQRNWCSYSFLFCNQLFPSSFGSFEKRVYQTLLPLLLFLRVLSFHQSNWSNRRYHHRFHPWMGN